MQIAKLQLFSSGSPCSPLVCSHSSVFPFAGNLLGFHLSTGQNRSSRFVGKDTCFLSGFSQAGLIEPPTVGCQWKIIERSISLA